RREIEAYARAVGLRWREDPTNVEPQYERNRIRNLLLPELETASPGIGDRLLALADTADAVERAWATVADDLLERAVLARDASRIVLARDVLRGYHPTVRARVIRMALERIGSAPGRAGTLAA